MESPNPNGKGRGFRFGFTKSEDAPTTSKVSQDNWPDRNSHGSFGEFLVVSFPRKLVEHTFEKEKAIKVLKHKNSYME